MAGTTLNHHGIGLGPVWSKYQRAAETGAAIETAGGTAKIDKRSTWDLGKLALRIDMKGVQVRFIISGKIVMRLIDIEIASRGIDGEGAYSGLQGGIASSERKMSRSRGLR